jgi:glycine/D-amino acid oxidase-like deaminating enzyme
MTELSATGGRDVHTVRFPDATPPATVDVLIVGAGPVGLAAAVELTSRGVRVAVIDRARTARLVRAGAMGHTPRVVEHLRRWRLLQRVRDAWTYRSSTLSRGESWLGARVPSGVGCAGGAHPCGRLPPGPLSACPCRAGGARGECEAHVYVGYAP